MVALVSALLGHCGLFQGRSRHFDVLAAWFSLTFTHRREVLQIRDLVKLVGLDFQLVPDSDMMVVSSVLATLGSALCIRQRFGGPAAIA